MRNIHLSAPLMYEVTIVYVYIYICVCVCIYVTWAGDLSDMYTRA